MKLTCPNGHTDEYEHYGSFTTDMAWEDGTPDPNVHVSYYTCHTCQVDFMLVQRDGYVSEVRAPLLPGKFIESPKVKHGK